jgi:TolA-binding protein
LGLKDNTDNAQNGKSFSIIAIVTMLVGFATIWNVMSSQIDTLRAENLSLQEKVEAHEKIIGHSGSSERISRLEERFSAMDKSIEHTRDVANMRHQEMQLDIAMLWEKTFSTDYPQRTYWPFVYGGVK